MSFADDLAAAYPDAKVILCKRDVGNWVKSVNQIILRVIQWPSFKVLRYLDSKVGLWHEHLTLIWQVFCDNNYDTCGDRFLQHNAFVTEVVPPHRLLDYNVGEGWGPLYRFLEVPEPGPEQDSSNINDRDDFLHGHDQWWRDLVYRKIKQLAIPTMCCFLTDVAVFLH